MTIAEIDPDRPRRFSDVVGQDYPVKYLSGLIVRGQLPRTFLLAGTVGSGKTTLARIYGLALLCHRPEADGSPCWQCDVCNSFEAERRTTALFVVDPPSRFCEYDVTGNGGDLERVRTFVERAKARLGERARYVLFFDEAHGLDGDAADFMLKQLEQEGNVVFLFATSEHHRLAPALKSRLTKLQVKPLSLAAAVQFLKSKAREADLEFEDEAVVMLASVVNGQPRDLVKALQQTPHDGKRISVADVRSVFDMGYLDALRPYLLALGRGDGAELSRRYAAWHDSSPEKLRWVIAVLAGIYYLDLLGIGEFEADPVLELLASERSAALTSLRSHMSKALNADLINDWAELIAFWSLRDLEADGAAIDAKFAAFHLAVEGMGHSAVPEKTDKPVRPLVEVYVAAPETEAGFIDTKAVVTILERASFLTQEYGVLFNAAFELDPKVLYPGNQSKQRKAIDDFLDATFDELARHSDQFAGIGVIEGDEGNLYGRLVLYAPTVSPGGLEYLRDWYQRYLLGAPEQWAQLSTVLNSKGGTKWHWTKVIDLCAGIDDELMVPNRDKVNRPVLELLGASRAARVPTTSPEDMLRFYGVLTKAAIEAACVDGMRPISAIADRRWDLVQSGWERDEFNDRRTHKAERQEELANLIHLHSEPAARLKAEEQLRAQWAGDPRNRRRQWRGWWSGDDA